MKTHWKQLVNPDYLGAYSLPEGKDIIVKIKSVERGVVKGAGGREDECTIAHLESQKPFILNNTNCKTIAKLFKTPYIQDWAGKSIQVFQSTTSLKGETVECLRIRDFEPKLVLPMLEQSDTQIWGNAVAKVKEAGFDSAIKAIEKRYVVSGENKKALKDEATKA